MSEKKNEDCCPAATCAGCPDPGHCESLRRDVSSTDDRPDLSNILNLPDAEALIGWIHHQEALAALAEPAWGVIANAGGWPDKDWATEGWAGAAERWRDDYHAALATKPELSR